VIVFVEAKNRREELFIVWFGLDLWLTFVEGNYHRLFGSEAKGPFKKEERVMIQRDF